jgi:hypothetical protein
MSVYIPDIIQGVVNSFKTSIIINSFVQNGIYQTIYTSNTKNLSDGLYVEIQGENFQIIDLINNTSFVIKNSKIITDLTYTLACNYIFGHPIEIANQLDFWDKNTTYKFKKFPVICLFLDYEQLIDQNDYDIFFTANLWLAIVTDTDRQFTASQRLEQKFKPILQPLYELFIEALKSNINIITENNGLTPHTKIDRYYYGSEGKEQNIINSFADAIEIKNLKIKVFNSNIC